MNDLTPEQIEQRLARIVAWTDAGQDISAKDVRGLVEIIRQLQRENKRLRDDAPSTGRGFPGHIPRLNVTTQHHPSQNVFPR